MTDEQKQHLAKWAAIVLTAVTMLAGHFHYSDRLDQIEQVASVICEAVEEAEGNVR